MQSEEFEKFIVNTETILNFYRYQGHINKSNDTVFKSKLCISRNFYALADNISEAQSDYIQVYENSYHRYQSSDENGSDNYFSIQDQFGSTTDYVEIAGDIYIVADGDLVPCDDDPRNDYFDSYDEEEEIKEAILEKWYDGAHHEIFNLVEGYFRDLEKLQDRITILSSFKNSPGFPMLYITYKSLSFLSSYCYQLGGFSKFVDYLIEHHSLSRDDILSFSKLIREIFIMKFNIPYEEIDVLNFASDQGGLLPEFNNILSNNSPKVRLSLVNEEYLRSRSEVSIKIYNELMTKWHEKHQERLRLYREQEDKEFFEIYSDFDYFLAREIFYDEYFYYNDIWLDEKEGENIKRKLLPLFYGYSKNYEINKRLFKNFIALFYWFKYYYKIDTIDFINTINFMFQNAYRNESTFIIHLSEVD
ncbi:MAG: hypothetical protein AMXMBFR51_29330 [Ignavibacteriota bacterium]